MSLALIAKQLVAPQSAGCHLCRTLLCSRERLLCERCLAALDRCRVPGVEAASRLHAPVALALAAFWHQAEARELLHLLKYGHDASAALPLAYGMCGAYLARLALLAPLDAVAAVPLHPSRLNARGYNQAELLALAFSGAMRLPYLPGALVRVRRNASQVRRTREQRLAAMQSAFVATRSFDGMRLLLVDDVLTTGATASACAQRLLAAGAAEVSLLTATMA